MNLSEIKPQEMCFDTSYFLQTDGSVPKEKVLPSQFEHQSTAALSNLGLTPYKPTPTNSLPEGCRYYLYGFAYYAFDGTEAEPLGIEFHLLIDGGGLVVQNSYDYKVLLGNKNPMDNVQNSLTKVFDAFIKDWKQAH